MSRSIIEKQIAINASPGKVWRVFTDRTVTKQMGGEYASDWKVGGSFGWRSVDGTMLTHGKILQIETGKLLQHSLLDPDDEKTVISTITYQFSGDDGHSVLSIREEMPHDLTEEEYKDAIGGWEAALSGVKGIAEKL